MLGVTVLILVIAVMTGFDRELRQKVIDFDAHILVTSEDVFRDWRALKAKIDKTRGVVATAPFVQGPVIVEFHNRRLAPLIRGVDPEQEEKVIPLQKFIKFGKLDLEGESTVLGIELARKLGVSIGDKVTIYSPGNLGQVLDSIKKLENANGEEEKKAIDELRDVILPKELTVTGIFETGHYLHDSEFLLVPVYVAQELYVLDAFVLHRDRGGFWNHEHAHHRNGTKAARDRNCESARGERCANCLGVPWSGDNCRPFWNDHWLGPWDDVDPLPQRVQSLAGIDVAHRDFPARSLSILVDPGRSHST